MKLVGKVPIEPLDDERLTNIERKIVAGAADAAASGRTHVRFGLTFGFAAATVVIALGAGLVGYKLHKGGTEQVADSSPLHVQSDAIATTIDIGDARITSDPTTTFDVTRPDGGVLIGMARGKVSLEVGKRGNRPPLIVRAGDTDVEVVGTRFSVDFGDGTGSVEVKVTEGVVKVHHKRDADARVAAGEQWKVDREGHVAFFDHAAVIAAAEKKPDEIEIPMPEIHVGLHDRVAQVPDAKIPTTPQNGSASKPPQGPELIRRPVVDRPTSPHVNLMKEINAQAIDAPLDVGNLVPAEAVSRYRQMAAFGTSGAAADANQAAMAFYSIAYVQHMKLARHSDAIQTLDAYFRRFRPNVTSYQAARWLQVRVRCMQSLTLQKSVDDQCRQAAFTYAHEFPGSPAASIANVLSESN